MDSSLSEDHHSKLKVSLVWGLSMTLIVGVFFLGLFLAGRNPYIKNFLKKSNRNETWEIFGFAPFWSLDRLSNINWNVLTTFAYFSIPVNADGSLNKESYEWSVFNSQKLKKQFDLAKSNNVKRVVTLTQMENGNIELFLADSSNWQRLAQESVDLLSEDNLEGVNIDFEYMPSNDFLRERFSEFVDSYSQTLSEKLPYDPYITVSVIASSEKGHSKKIYDIQKLSKSADSIFMMAYDFYYPGSEEIGPSAPLYGYNEGKGPFWYDVSTAVEDFLKVTEPGKIIMGVPYYGWNYPAYSPEPKTPKLAGTRGFPTTNEKVDESRLLKVTPLGGWDDQAKVSWRSYWDGSNWYVVYMEDENSLSYKFDFVKDKKLAGVGIWALGFDSPDSQFWSLILRKFGEKEKGLAFLGN